MSSRLHPAALLLSLLGCIPLTCAQATPLLRTASTAPSAEFPTSLRDALAVAVTQRPDIRAAEQKLAGARQRTLEAAARFYPSLDFGIQARDGINYDTFSGITVTGTILGQPLAAEVTKTQPRYLLSPYVRISYDLYTGGRDSAQRQNAAALERSTMLEADILSRSILREVIVCYLQVLKARERYRLAKHWLSYAEAHEKLTLTRAAHGKASDFDLQTDALNTAQRRFEFNNATQQLADRYTDYLSALGLPPEAAEFSPERIESLGGNVDGELKALDAADASMSNVLGAPPRDSDVELQKARADLEAARHTITAERAGYRPQVNLFAQYDGIGRNDNNFGDAYHGIRRSGFQMGLTMTLNVFSGYATAARVDQAQANAERVSMDVQRLENQLKHARNRLSSELELALAQENFARERRKRAELQLRIAEAKAGVGRSEVDAVNLAQMELAAIDSDIACSRLDASMARVKLKFASSADARSRVDQP